MKVLVWQWGRMGAGPRLAVMLAEGLRGCEGTDVVLSLSRYSDVLNDPDPPACDLPFATYRGHLGFFLRGLAAPWMIMRLARRLRAIGPPDLAVCALPGPLDMIMVCALRRLGVPSVVIVHDADAHPGDGVPFLMPLQRWLSRSADAVAALTTHVGERLVAQGITTRDRLIRLFHPPMRFQRGTRAEHARPEGGPLRLLFFGRLLPYKGLDLLVAALDRLGPDADIALRVIGSGPKSPELDRLRAHPRVTVENRWVPEAELDAILAEAQVMVLPYREASQSGVAAAGLAAGCAIVATDVGGLREQLADQPNVTLCPPEAEAIAAVIRAMERERPVTGPGVDVEAAWQRMAADLLRQAAERGLVTS